MKAAVDGMEWRSVVIFWPKYMHGDFSIAGQITHTHILRNIVRRTDDNNGQLALTASHFNEAQATCHLFASASASASFIIRQKSSLYN